MNHIWIAHVGDYTWRDLISSTVFLNKAKTIHAQSVTFLYPNSKSIQTFFCVPSSLIIGTASDDCSVLNLSSLKMKIPVLSDLIAFTPILTYRVCHCLYVHERVEILVLCKPNEWPFTGVKKRSAGELCTWSDRKGYHKRQKMRFGQHMLIHSVAKRDLSEQGAII